MANLISVLIAFLRFPDAVGALVRLLMKTPEEKHQDLIGLIIKERDNFLKTGRPSE